ncbi:MAG: 6,7-dimethyl-8-ribityllumazine synthase [Phycisphaerae bacterium]|nr:MAG: 6,7-dimethyl-8-ribityllumazine synthase [Phycisphaerae bacterium]
MAIVVSRYNASITTRLLAGAVEVLRASPAGMRERFVVIDAPGAFELPVLAHVAAASGRFDGVLALGCIIKGQTIHDRVIADAIAHGLIQVSLAHAVPCAFGVLTVNTPAQAAARAGGRLGNKGAEAMEALLMTIAAAQAIRSSTDRVPAWLASYVRRDKAASARRTTS